VLSVRPHDNRPLTALQPCAAQAAFAEYYRCAHEWTRLNTSTSLSSTAGFFTYRGQRGYGRVAGAEPSREISGTLPDVSAETRLADGCAVMPFDLAEVVTNLRRERYGCKREAGSGAGAAALPEQLYYWLRPFMSVGFRRHLQQIRLRNWQQIPFPSWPVDTTVDDLMRETVGAQLRASGAERFPFIWFWPDGAPSCTMLTHDVEGERGLKFCETLLDLDADFGVRAAYQLVPEGQTDVWPYADVIRRRGCEVNLHDLNHDGRLYWSRAQFLERARRINEHARQRGCRGFRSGAMYREQDWYDAFSFEYDMSVPNSAHLEPQRGGCCTVMPYFVGDLLELPLTMVQDYSLFFILRDYSTRLWREQMDRIAGQHGLISIITHPDYLIGDSERAVYRELLGLIAELRQRGGTWVAQPGEVNDWWRSRRDMTLRETDSGWTIDGEGSERARVAYASLDGDRVVYNVS
jgi:hypothetical protein